MNAADGTAVEGRDVWLVHPWNLGQGPTDVPTDILVIGACVADFHRQWPWSERRWRFVGKRMAELAAQRWYGDAASIGYALAAARSVRSTDEPHLAPWLSRWARCQDGPELFPRVDPCCDTFSQWWTRATRGLDSATDLMSRERRLGS
jgi:deoxyribodipyrimidine photo-lyase